MVQSSPPDRATDETGSTPIPVSPGEVDDSKTDTFSGIRRALREEELAAPGALRLLVVELDRLSKELSTARWFQEKYFETKEALARIEERQKRSAINEILATACLTGGSVGIGAAKTYIDVTSYGWLIFGVSVLFVVAGMVARVRR
jgi:energy-converting hydrogenase Eha subunit C